VESAADVDALRAALGYERMTLVGGSYGSHLALATLRAHPERVERVVLYGVEGPDHTWDDPAGRLRALERIAAATEAAPAFRGKVPPDGLIGALRSVIERLEAKPERVVIERDGGELTVVVDAAAVRLSAAGRAGRRSRAWQWPQRILDLHRGDYRAFAEGALEGRELRIAPPMHSMMDCASGVSPERAERYARDPAAAIVGDVNLEYRAVCDAWGAPDLGLAFRAPVVSAVPALLLHGTWDTSTPIENAREVASSLSNAQLVEVLEGGHGALYNLLEHWPPMRRLLAAFLRGEPVRFPPQVALPPVAFEAPPGDH
jgi:pimeloyl-ACP methyl ester carboxylesterase